ncbi:DUF4102 domain-containing protein [Lampropedia aestuarii]|uniref:DUF4102 domain-containing protein n=2 Tax=Lampropedia TaxID=198705 RepID=A0A4V3YXB8_9BURK|nr:integrase arm-type DNA-binding domain-containing protein [Lampropedia aestuarii]THJ34502.1 DUF4102 domain-containing protein [Lampropedia aestuarii]
MPQAISKARDRLTALAVKNTKEPGMYHDGAGLYLQVAKGGSKTWILRYTLNKKTREMGLGSISDWSLAEARERARKFRQSLSDGIDPIEMRKETAAQVRIEQEEKNRKSRTFEQCATEYFEVNQTQWKNVKHRAQWINTLASYAFPKLGRVPVSEISRDHIREVLLPIWKTKAETASRVLQRIRTVINHAAAMGYCTGLDSQQWEQLKLALPKNTVEREVTHHASCPHHEVASLVTKVQEGAASQVVKLAFEFIVLTACRSGEARGATWEEIDFRTNAWIIPKERMKANRSHSIPLSEQALAILQKAKALSPEFDKKLTGLIFPSRKKAPLSDMTFTQVLRRMGVNYTMHGFRASFRTWGAELGHYEHDMLEVALSHVIGDETVRAYQRSDMVERRRALMTHWSVYCGDNSQHK